MIATRESEVEDYLIRIVRSHGGEVRKIKFVGRDGAPDRLVMLPSQPVRPGGQLWSEPRTLWVEVKAPGLAATFPSNPHERKQYREHERLRKVGQRVEVVDSYDGVDALFK